MKAIVFYRSGKSELINSITEVIWDDGGNLTLVRGFNHGGTYFTRFFASENLARVQLSPE